MSHFASWDLVGKFEAMGPIARVIVILLLAMLARAAIVALDKYFCFALARKQTQSFVRLAAAPLSEGDLDETRRIAETKGKSHVAKIVAAGINAFISAEPSLTQADKIDAAKRNARQVITLNRAEFSRRLSGLGTIASTAPFVGLLGTVIGIVDSFRGIIGTHATGLSAVASGIAEALFTTALGLIVAIPAVWCFNYFTEKMNDFSIEMNTASLELVTYLSMHPVAEPRQK
ncbi:MAG: MotA/TolQ/ExbB proton channel family protein [Candidatus Acidiferrales bacterium]